jgi:predicted transposase/invertase (TIGR01784 family)
MSKSSPKGRTLISFDWAMKRLLKQKANHGILDGFLSELFKLEVRVTDILDSESIAENEEDKTNRVDLLCKNDRGELIIIELQYYQETDYFQRMLFGASKLVLEYLHKSSPYGEIKKIYAVHIVYFHLGMGQDYVYRGRQQFTGMHRNDTLRLKHAQSRKFGGADPADLYPEYYVINICNFMDEINDTLDEWIYYFKHSKLPLGHRAMGLEQAAEQLNIDNMKPEVKEKYMKQLSGYGISEKLLEDNWFDGESEGEYKGFIRGKEEGLMTGAQMQLEANVFSMHKHGMSIVSIAEILGMKPSDIEAIVKKPGTNSEGIQS